MKSFRLNILLRIIVLSTTLYFFFYLIQSVEFTTSSIIMGIFCLMQVYFLFKYADRTNREISKFLLSIKYSDFSQTFSDQNLGKSFTELSESFNEVIKKFQKTRAEKEEHYRYLTTVTQHVGVGLLSFDEDGDVEFINNSAKQLLKIKFLNNISALDRVHTGLSKKIFNLNPGRKNIIKITDEYDILQLILLSTEFKMRGKLYKLVSLQNIHSELEDKEIEAWQKLIRVLTHEIMNSITPISSLASTVNHMLIKQSGKGLNEENITDIKSAASTIQKRSEGLIHFVNDYRSLTKIPKPNFEVFPIIEIFERIGDLMEPNFTADGIDFSYKIIPKHIKVTCDPDLIEQVIINLIVNSTHALAKSKNPKILLFAGLDTRGRLMIKVVDNGPGLTEDLIEKIFIPFFSTKAEGSGIGLSLSKQIVKAHGGTIGVQSKPNKETVFTIKF